MAQEYTIGPDIDLDVEEVFVAGRRYTNADADADSEYFEKRAGRPSLAHGTSPQVSFRVPREVKDQLASLSEAEGRPEAQVARQALLEYLARHRGA
jgi:hypothetical protein